MTIETQRLILRPWRIEDAEDMFEYAKNPDIGPCAGWKPHDSMEESQKIITGWLKAGEEHEIFALEHKESGRAIGSLGIEKDGRRENVPGCRSMGYVLAKEFWGQGLMLEAVDAALTYAFETKKLKIVTIDHYTDNARSRRVIEKAGFTLEGTLRRGTVIYDGTVKDVMSYSMTAAEYYLKRAWESGLSLTLPEETSREAIEDYLQEWQESRVIPAALNWQGQDYERWLARTIALRTYDFPPLVSATTWFLTDSDGKLLGAVDLRHRLNDYLMKAGGHIGYGLRPSCRGKGYAKKMLALALEQAKDKGITRVLVTCDDSNFPSSATIEACGGERDATDGNEGGEIVRRYWINL